MTLKSKKKKADANHCLHHQEGSACCLVLLAIQWQQKDFEASKKVHSVHFVKKSSLQVDATGNLLLQLLSLWPITVFSNLQTTDPVGVLQSPQGTYLWKFLEVTWDATSFLWQQQQKKREWRKKKAHQKSRQQKLRKKRGDESQSGNEDSRSRKWYCKS